MINVKIKLHKMKLENQENEDSEGNIIKEINNNTTIKELLETLKIEQIGKVIIINQKAVHDYNTTLQDNYFIEIFKMYAGG